METMEWTLAIITQRKQQGKAGINIDSNKWHNLHS